MIMPYILRRREYLSTNSDIYIVRYYFTRLYTRSVAHILRDRLEEHILDVGIK
jgi:hypothetical protein